MNYAALETEITDRLNGYLADTFITGSSGPKLSTVLAARAMPENAAEVLKEYDKGMANVQYVDSLYGEVESTSEIVQEETVKVALFLQVNSMKENGGGYQLLAAIKASLLGYKPEGARTRMWISDYGDWQIQDGELQPFIEFSFKAPVMQVIDDSEPPLEGSGPLTVVSSELYTPGS